MSLVVRLAMSSAVKLRISAVVRLVITIDMTSDLLSIHPSSTKVTNIALENSKKARPTLKKRSFSTDRALNHWPYSPYRLLSTRARISLMRFTLMPN